MKKKTDRTENLNLDNLIGRLKQKDTYYARLIKYFQAFYWVLVPLYLFVSIWAIWADGDYWRGIGYLCYLLSMLIFALYFRYYYRMYNFVDYSLPTIVMLKEAVKRYQPFRLSMLWGLLAIFLTDVGLVLQDWPDTDVVLSQILFWGMMTLAVLGGLTIWWFRYKPLRDDAIHLIREIEGEDN